MEDFKMTITLNNNQKTVLRLLDKEDSFALYSYLQNLSAESRSRFGPHLFDADTINNICENLAGDTFRFIAEDEGQNIVAYMLVKKGMIEADRDRYHPLNIFLDEHLTITYAPSVADAWQNSGLGSIMFTHIRNYVTNMHYQHMVLWGSVQTLNARAVHFYTKHGFKQLGSFWFDGKDNLDMMLSL
ncbi:MAG: GNAT family N-acetyltransferase [Panacibacter sp.]